MSQGVIVLMACGSFSPPTPMHFRMFEIAKDYFHAIGTHKVVGGIISPVHDEYGKKDLIPASHRCNMLQLALNSSDWIKLSKWEVNQEGWTRTRRSLKYHQESMRKVNLNQYFHNPILSGTTDDQEKIRTTNYMNSYLNDSLNIDAIDGKAASWLPDDILNRSLSRSTDDVDHSLINENTLNGNDGERNNNQVQLKLLCGADLLESFATPGLWSDDDLEAILGEHGLVVITRSGGNPEKFIYDSDVLTRYRRNISIITNWVPNEVSSTMIRRLIRRGESVKYLIDDNIISYIKQNQLYGISDRKTMATVHAFSS